MKKRRIEHVTVDDFGGSLDVLERNDHARTIAEGREGVNAVRVPVERTTRWHITARVTFTAMDGGGAIRRRKPRTIMRG